MIIFFLLAILITISKTMACFSITDDNNFQNPVLNANFNLLPDVSPLTDCWTGAIRIRSDKNNWRLVANRTGPDATSANGDTSNNIKANDISIEFELKNFGMAQADGAILVYPFSTKADLSSIESGTFLLSGIKKTGNSCSPNNPNFYQLKKSLCLFRDFVFNTGEYNAQISYILVAP